MRVRTVALLIQTARGGIMQAEPYGSLRRTVYPRCITSSARAHATGIDVGQTPGPRRRRGTPARGQTGVGVTFFFFEKSTETRVKNPIRVRPRAGLKI